MDDAGHLRKLLASAEDDERRLAAAKEKVEAEYAKAKEKSDLLRRLIGLTGDAGITEPHHVGPAERPAASPRPVEAGSLEDQAERVLAAAGKPIHVRDIRSALVEAGVPLPGRGDEANVIVRLARDTERFVRTGRGTYGLTSWGVPEVRPTRKRRVSRG